jgi:gonadotropin-releasing hormone receptor
MNVEWIFYLILFAIGAPANILVLWRLLHNGSYKKSRHHFLLLNLSIADAIVVFIMIPVDIGWKYTIAWHGGNLLCKASKFFAAFGTYSSSLLLISVSVDRYYAVVRPFKYAFLDRKMNMLLIGIWFFSFLISTPQVSSQIIFTKS